MSEPQDDTMLTLTSEGRERLFTHPELLVPRLVWAMVLAPPPSSPRAADGRWSPLARRGPWRPRR